MTGPLETYVSGFASELVRVGYTQNVTADQLRLFAHLSRWLATQGLEAAELTATVGDAFLTARRAAGYRLWLSRKALRPLLEYLRDLGAAPPEPIRVPTPTEVLLERYREYLTSERGVACTTARGYVHMVRPFLRTREAPDGTLELTGLVAGHITAFVVAEAPGRRVGSAKLLVCALRSFLGFLHVDGMLAHSLTSAVPAVAGSRLAGLPKGLTSGQVRQLLASCDQRTAVGSRDFAVLTMLVRLGLRAGELVALELADVDWRGGEIVVRGKGNRCERLPLPVDVGQAIVTYLQHGRPASECRRLFLRIRAPRGALTSGGVTNIVLGAARKAGLPPVAAHRLRHTVASEMLRAGAPLREIGQVLRHRSLLSTAIYAKVDHQALRQLARPWPAGGVA
ncbi:MAG TPA: site-specific integrase [Ktedonobacterales bacterium]|nr:site-specific integrase [Ktedonobacterales bacterium]